MIVGALLIGGAIGAVSGLSALVLGSSVGMAILTYAGTGALGTLTTAMVFVFHKAFASKAEYTVRQEISPLQRG